MKKRAIRLLSMLLALLMLTGCSSSILNDQLDSAYRALQRNFISADRNLVPFDEMEYLRPDMSAISADFDAVNDALDGGTAGLDKYNELLSREYTGFLDNIEEAGFTSPFESGRVQRVADDMRLLMQEQKAA